MKDSTSRGVRIALLPLLLLACGSEVKESPLPGLVDGSVSGSRLRARLYRTESGVAQFRDWWDSELGAPCTFQLAADREWRCLPGDHSYSAYADAQCSRRVRAFQHEAAPFVTEGASFEPPAECWGPAVRPSAFTRIYRLTERLEATVHFDSGIAGDACSVGHPCAGADLIAYDPDAREEVSPAAFVRADVVILERTALVGARAFVADDGTTEIVEGHHLESDSACLGMAFGVKRCLPAAVAFADVIPWRGDAGCSRTVAHGYPVGCPEPELAFRNGGGHVATCDGAAASVHELGARVAGDTVFEMRGDRCEPVERPEEVFYELGEEVPLSAFAELSTRQLGDGKVQLQLPTTAGGDAPLAHGTLVNAHGSPVTLARVPDGTLRAFSGSLWYPPGQPSRTPGGGETFADAGCSEPGFLLSAPRCGGAPEEPLALLSDDCGVVTPHSVREVTAAYVMTPNGCDPLWPIPDGTKIYAVDAEMPADAFELIEEALD